MVFQSHPSSCLVFSDIAVAVIAVSLDGLRVMSEPYMCEADVPLLIRVPPICLTDNNASADLRTRNHLLLYLLMLLKGCCVDEFLSSLTYLKLFSNPVFRCL